MPSTWHIPMLGLESAVRVNWTVFGVCHASQAFKYGFLRSKFTSIYANRNKHTAYSSGSKSHQLDARFPRTCTQAFFLNKSIIPQWLNCLRGVIWFLIMATGWQSLKSLLTLSISSRRRSKSTTGREGWHSITMHLSLFLLDTREVTLTILSPKEPYAPNTSLPLNSEGTHLKIMHGGELAIFGFKLTRYVYSHVRWI